MTLPGCHFGSGIFYDNRGVHKKIKMILFKKAGRKQTEYLSLLSSASCGFILLFAIFTYVFHIHYILKCFLF